MIHLLAIVSLIISVIFYAFSVQHGVWSWILFMLIGLTLWCVSGHEKVP